MSVEFFQLKDAYIEGVIAAHYSRDLDDNPYREESQRAFWTSGYQTVVFGGPPAAAPIEPPVWKNTSLVLQKFDNRPRSSGFTSETAVRRKLPRSHETS